MTVAMSISFCTLFSPFQFLFFFLFETQLMGIIPIYVFFFPFVHDKLHILKLKSLSPSRQAFYRYFMLVQLL